MNDLNLNIDVQAMTAAFERAAFKMLDELAEEYLQTVTEYAESLGDQRTPDYKNVIASFRKEMATVLEEDESVAFLVGSPHWSSFILNYGMGLGAMNAPSSESMDLYRHSMWNPNRKGKGLVTRPNGEYNSPDWEGEHGGTGIVTKKGSGKNPPKSLDELFGKINPSEFMERATESFKHTLKAKIEELYNEFPFEDYVKGVD